MSSGSTLPLAAISFNFSKACKPLLAVIISFPTPAFCKIFLDTKHQLSSSSQPLQSLFAAFFLVQCLLYLVAPLLIAYNMNRSCIGMKKDSTPAFYYMASFKYTLTLVPVPSLLFTSTLPPAFSVILFTIKSPTPLPSTWS